MSGSFRPASRSPRSSRYPGPLDARVAKAEQLARALHGLSGESVPSDASFLWLLGRADEVRTFVDEILREWSEGSLDTARACDAIHSYVEAVHVALHRRYGGYAASCCGPHLEPFAGARPAANGGMRQRFKSGVLEADPADEAPASRTRPMARGPVAAQKRQSTIPPRRRQAG
jgi:hypothetical protein